MKKIHLIPVLILLAFCSSSCKKYLDVKSDSSLSVPTTLQDLQAMLDRTNTMNVFTPAYGEASADDYFLLDNAYNSRGEKDQHAYIWLPSVSTFNSDWARSSLAIYHTNICLEQIGKIDRSGINAAAWDNAKGSALFFRSYYFLQLAWTYTKAYDEASASTDLGIILRLVSDPNTASVRSSVKQSYQQIVKDAKEAAPLLPDNPIVAMRPSKAAAYALLARAFLSMRQYDSAFKYSHLSLGIKSELIDYNNPDDVNISNNIPFKKLNKETIFYTQMSTGYAGINPSRALTDTILYALYNNDDLRKTSFFRANGLYRRFKGSYAANANTHFSGITTAEIFLIRAECYARAGNKDLALADLNTLMIKRWNNTVPFPTFTATDAADALSKILIERRKELLFRGLRWMDIKRLNKEGTNIIPARIIAGQIYNLPPGDNRYALALPVDIIESSGVPQNPGW